MNSSEIRDIILVSLVLGFCFSYRNWGSGDNFLSVGLTNLAITTGIVFLSVALHILIQKIFASKYYVTARTRTWKLSLILALLSTVLTNGHFVFSAIWGLIISGKQIYQVGKKFEFVGPRARAKIAVVGPILNFLLGMVGFAVYLKTNSYFMQQLAYINFYFAVFNLFPFFRAIYLMLNKPMMKLNRKGENYWMKYLHKSLADLQKTTNPDEKISFSEGEVVFFGSRPTWFFFFPLILFSIVLTLITLNIKISLLISLLASIIIWCIDHYFIEMAGFRDKPKYEA
jgi:Zn-dependent protease